MEQNKPLSLHRKSDHKDHQGAPRNSVYGKVRAPKKRFGGERFEKDDRSSGGGRREQRGARTMHSRDLRRSGLAHTGFSPFQERLVLSILRSVFEERKSLDHAYALWFSKVKLESVEQGFIIRHVNEMFSRLSYFAFAAGLKRPSDFERHIQRLLFVYCAHRGWPLPELTGEEGLDRGGARKRLLEGRKDPLLSEGCPVWLDELGKKELGDKWPAQRKALGDPAPRFIRANTLKTDRNALAAELSDAGVVTRPVAGSSVALEVTSNAALFRTDAFRDGKFEQQDAGSQKIAEFLEPKPGERIIDACAGAGGKTLQMAALMEGKGTIIAMDTEQWKLDDLKKRARRAGAFNIEPRLIDSTKVVKRLAGAADRVLIDAPCSGTGVIRRQPDSKWRDGSDRLREIRHTQADILERYALMARVGGIVVYSTCSIMPSEDEDQVKAFLEKHPSEFELKEERRLWPADGTDGFYMAKLERTGERPPVAKKPKDAQSEGEPKAEAKPDTENSAPEASTAEAEA